VGVKAVKTEIEIW